MKRLHKYIDYYYNNVLVALGLRSPVIYTKHESYCIGTYITDEAMEDFTKVAKRAAN